MIFSPKRPCNLISPSSFHEYLHKARDACHWVGHFNDDPLLSPTDNCDDYLTDDLEEPQPQGCCGGGGRTCQIVDVFLYMVLKARQAAAAMAVIMLSAIVIALRSAQFISYRWSQTFGTNCKTSGVHMFCFQATVLCTLNLFVLLAVYWPAYHAFLRITGVMAWIITALKATVLSIFIVLP